MQRSIHFPSVAGMVCELPLQFDFLDARGSHRDVSVVRSSLMDFFSSLPDGATGLDSSGRPGADDIDHSGTFQDDGKSVPSFLDI